MVHHRAGEEGKRENEEERGCARYDAGGKKKKEK